MTRISRNEVMKNYWIGVFKTLLLFLWAVGMTWLASKCNPKPYELDMFCMSVLFIMVCILSVSHFSNEEEDKKDKKDE